jgi:phosphate transport system substrate-binding protein
MSTKNTSLTVVAMLLALGVAPKPLVNKMFLSPAIAQSSSTSNKFELPTSVPEGTKVQIDGSQSMTAIDTILKQNFEKQFPNTEVKVQYRGTDAALKSLQEGTIDVAAIGRPLSAQEKAQGLREVPLKRHKIAILVGAENPFQGSITIAQFAKIIRGEITDWSELGGAPGQIKVIDQPESAETRKAFQNYPVFRKTPFQTGANAVRLSEDSVEEAIAKLGKDGITYGLANRLTEFPGARVLAMHKTTPDDPRYPFSQPLYYVYNSNKLSPAAQAFLGFATAPDNQQTLNDKLMAGITGIAGVVGNVLGDTSTTTPEGKATTAQTPGAGTTTSEGKAQTPGAGTTTPEGKAQTPGAGTTTPEGTAQTPGAGTTTPGSSSTTPEGKATTAQTPGAGTTTPEGKATTAQTPGAGTTIPGSSSTTPEGSTTTAQTPGSSSTTPEGKATTAQTPGTGTTTPEGTAQTPGAGTTTPGSSTTTPEEKATTAQTPGSSSTTPEGTAQTPGAGTTTPGSSDTTPEGNTTTAQTPGAETNASGDRDAKTKDNSQETAFLPDAGTKETSPAGGMPPWLWWLLPLAAIGGMGAWLLKSRSNSRSSTAVDVDSEPRGGVIPESTATSTPPTTSVAPTSFDTDTATRTNVDTSDIAMPSAPSDTGADVDVTSPATETAAAGSGLGAAGVAGLARMAASSKNKSRTILVPRNDKSSYAYWEIDPQEREELKRQGGQKLALRLYDATNVDDSESQQPELLQQYDCEESAQDREILIPASDRDYEIELGYVTEDDRWLSLSKSAPIRVMPSSVPDDGSMRENGTEQAGKIGGAAVAGAAGIAGAAAAAQSFVSETPTKLQEDSNTQLQTEAFTSEVPTKLQNSDTNLQPEARVVITPRDSQHVYAYWELPEQLKHSSKLEGGEQLALRLYDVTGIDLDQQSAHSMEEYPCDESTQDVHLSVPQSDRDYLVELGYITVDRDWLSLARSTHVHVPAQDTANGNAAIETSDRQAQISTATPNEANPTASSETGSADKIGGAAIAGMAGIAGAAAAAQPFVSETPTQLQSSDTNPQLEGRVVLAPLDSQHVYAYWEVSQEQKDAAKNQGGKQLTIRLYDVTNIDLNVQPAHSMQEYTCSELSQDLHLSVPQSDRDYLVDLGYTTETGDWLRIARSTHVHVPAAGSNQVEATAKSSSSFVSSSPTNLQTSNTKLQDDPTNWHSRIILVPGSSQNAYAFWEINEKEQEELKRQGGQTLALRLYDVTNINSDSQDALIVEQYHCDETSPDQHLNISVSDRDYQVAIGYLTQYQRWLSLAKSSIVRISS